MNPRTEKAITATIAALKNPMRMKEEQRVMLGAQHAVYIELGPNGNVTFRFVDISEGTVSKFSLKQIVEKRYKRRKKSAKS